MEKFTDKISKNVKDNKSCLIVGLDLNLDSLPNCIKDKIDSEETFIEILTTFYKKMIDISHKNIIGYKPNIAFYEAYGLPGLTLFSNICNYINEKNSILITDAKRGDIGSTAEAYAKAFFTGSKYKNLDFRLNKSDALTVNPFLGLDTLVPFITAAKKTEKGIFLLVKTSNPGSNTFQEAKIKDQTITDFLATYVNDNSDSSELSSIGAVVGSTYPEQARYLRSLMKTAIFLVPGYGAQGGSAQDALAGYSIPGSVLISSSRGIFNNFKEDINLDDYLELISQRIKAANEELKQGWN